MTITERLFDTAKRKNLKQTDLANALGIKPQLINNWKTRGTTPPMEYLPAICEVLDISWEYLIVGEESAEHYTEDEKRLIEQYRKLDSNNKSEVLQYTTFKAQTRLPFKESAYNANFALAVANAAQAMEKAEVKGILKSGKKRVPIKKEAST